MAEEPAAGAVHVILKRVSSTLIICGVAGWPGGVSATSVTKMVTGLLVDSPLPSVAVTVTE